jgi:uncharacterized protein
VETHPHRRTVIWRLLYFLASFYVGGVMVGGIAMGWLALHASSAPIRPYEERNARAAALSKSVEFRDVEITTPDAVILRAWYMRPQEASGDAVILLHSISGNRVEMYDYGKWLVENHYSVLLPDERHHGDSGGLSTYGVKEADDIHRWVDWIETNEPARCVYGLGESTGAAELLESLPHEPRFCAVVAESANATFREEEYTQLGRLFHAGPWLGRILFRPTVDVGFLYVRLRYGINLEAASPEQAVVDVKTPILLIHGLDDTYIPPYNSDLIQAKNPAIVVWKVPGAVHVGARKAAPQEFERRVLGWFAEHPATAKPTSAPISN